MKRITIIIDEDTYDRLPIKGKSPFINLVLKNHFRKDSAEDLYKWMKNKLLQDPEFSTTNTTNQTQSVVRTYQPCCSGYPHDLDCGHWYRLDENYLKNKRNGETREY